MAGSYTLPQVRVFQEFAEAPNDVTQNLNPFVIGPNYQLIRYSDADTRDECRNKQYTEGTSVELQWVPGYAGSKVDTRNFGVTIADAHVKLGEPITAASCIDIADGSGTKFEFTLGDNKTLAGTSDVDKLYFKTPIKAGDYVAYTADGKTVYTKIRSVSCGKLGTGEITHSVKQKSTGKVVSGVVTVNTDGYTGEKDVSVNMTISADGDSRKIAWSSDVAGVSGAATAFTGEINLGKGLTVTPGSSTAVGTYVLVVKLVAPYVVDTVTVSDAVPCTAGSIPSFTFLRRINAVEVGSAYLTADDTKVTVSSGVTVDSGVYAGRVVFSGTAYLSQRNLVSKHSDGVYSVRTKADIIAELGVIDPANPLAYALDKMLLNCAQASVRFMSLTSDDSEGYAKALDRASVTSDVYAFCPLTEDKSIIDDVVAHCNLMSDPESKAWRIAFFSAPTARMVDVTPSVNGSNEFCTVAGTTLTCCDSSSAPSKDSKFIDTVAVGDTVDVVTSTGELVSTTVAEVKTNNMLVVSSAVANADKACSFTITHRRGDAEYVSAIAATSMNFRDRRAYNVFPNSMIDTDGNYVSGMYGAAAVCALACSVAPQQPITNVEIKGFAELPDVYSTFSRDQLNEIAAGGTLILMQDRVGSTVYVRHQISTAYSDNNLNTTELSLTKNLDSISFYFANRFAPYIGRYNLTDDLLSEIEAVLKDGISYLSSATETNRLIGPQVIAEGTEIRAIYRHESKKDKAYADVGLNLPAPFNNFDLRLQVI